MFKFIILLIILIPACVLLGNFLLMLILGALSHVFGVPRLSLSFWQSLIVYIALWMVGGFFGNQASAK